MTTKQAPTLSSIYEDDEKFGWMDRIAEPLQEGLKSLFNAFPAGSRLKGMLNGTPIQHRLHPAIVTVPIGAFTTSLVLDGLGRFGDKTNAAGYSRAADAAIAFGIVSTAPAIKTGLADWMDLYDHRRRVGIAHALFNSAALACYAASLALRKSSQDQRGAAQILSATGFGLLAMGGAIGGELVYILGVNTPHNLYPKPPNEEVDVLASDALVEGKPVVVEVGRVPVMLVRSDGEIHAVDAWCPHAGGPLADGDFEGDTVVCPWHQSRFCLRDGKALDGPAASPLRTFTVREAAGRIILEPSYEGQSWPPPPDPPSDNA